jgi:hypothetical protein
MALRILALTLTFLTDAYFGTVKGKSVLGEGKFGDSTTKFGDSTTKFGDSTTKFGDSTTKFGDSTTKLHGSGQLSRYSDF